MYTCRVTPVYWQDRHTPQSNTALLWKTVCVTPSTSLNIRPSHVSPITDSLIKESSPGCHLHNEGCLLNGADIFFEGGWRVKLYNRVSLFLPGEFSLVQWGGKSKLEVKAGWRVDQPSKLHSVDNWSCAEGNGVAPQYYHITLGWAYCNIVMLMLHPISMQRHLGIEPLSQWFLKQKLCEWKNYWNLKNEICGNCKIIIYES